MSSKGQKQNKHLSAISNLLFTDCLRLGAVLRDQGQFQVNNASPTPADEFTRNSEKSECLEQAQVVQNGVQEMPVDVAEDLVGTSKMLESLSEETRNELLKHFPPGHWEYHCGIRLKWVQVDVDEDLILKQQFLRSKASPWSGSYHVNNVPYMVDFSRMRRRNLATKKERHARFVGDLPFAPPPRSNQPIKKQVVAASVLEAEPQPPEEYSEPSSLYVVDDKVDYVYVWLHIEIGNMLHRVKVGHVEIDIRKRSIEVRVLDVNRKQTLLYRWVHLREVDVQRSSWRAAQDGDRLVIKLAKGSLSNQPWKTVFENPELGKYYFRFTQEPWPDTIALVQGCWSIETENILDCDNPDDEDTLPCKAIIFGSSVVTFGHSDFFQRRQLSTERGNLTLTEDGEAFHGKVAKKGGRIDWDDGETWTRDKAMDASYIAGNCDPLPQEALNIEPNEAMLFEDASIRLSVELEEHSTPLGQQQKELLSMLTDDSDAESAEGNSEILELTAEQPLPANLLSRIRVCCLDSQELTPQTAPVTLARLQRQMPLADATEIAALVPLELLLRWCSEFISPAQQATLSVAIRRVQLLLEEARLRQKKSGSGGNAALGVHKSVPVWWVSMRDPPLAKIATDMLRDELRSLRPSGRFADNNGELSLPLAFSVARRAVSAQIWSVVNPVQRFRCLRNEVARARRFATSTMNVLAERGGWVDFNDSGLLVLSSVVDWTTLLIARQEAERWFEEPVDCGGLPGEASIRIECNSIDLLQKGHRCLYACARICRLVLAHAGVHKLTREAGMSAGDGFLWLEKELPEDDEMGSSAFLCLATPENPFETWKIAMPTGLLDNNVSPCGGMLLVCRRTLVAIQSMLRVGDSKPLWIRVSV